MGMREKIAWRHVINQKGNLYLMDEAEKTYIVDFGKLNPKATNAFHKMHLFHMTALYALPIAVILLTLPYQPDLLIRMVLIVGAVMVVYLISYVWMLNWVVPQNIREILEEKKHK